MALLEVLHATGNVRAHQAAPVPEVMVNVRAMARVRVKVKCAWRL